MNKQVSKNQMSRNTTKVLYKTAVVEGLSIFYREAGDPGNPKLLLLHGFPASPQTILASVTLTCLAQTSLTIRSIGSLKS
jgi:hypothetical protein